MGTFEGDVVEFKHGYRLKPKAQPTGKEEKELWLHEENGTIYLFEWRPYLLVGNQEFVLHLFDEEIKATKITPETYMAEFQFKNYVGKSFIEIFENGQRTLKKPVEVLSKKVLDIRGIKERDIITKIVEEHRKFYNALFEDILRVSSSLPFSLSAPTAFVAGEGDEPVNELFAYHYFRNNGERIKEAFETVLRKAKRKLVEEDEWLELYEADEISPETLLSIIQRPEYLAPAGMDILVAEYFGGYAPIKILSSWKYESFDTPENRFAKYFLDTLIVWAERVIESFDNKNGKIDLRSIREALQELEFIRNHYIWDEVGEMTVFPYTSQTLLKGDGYRELLQLYREFTAYVPFFDELWRAIENKDLPTLYEYWAFFRLVEELGKILGKKKLRFVIKSTGELQERGSEVYAEFSNSWRLYYNRPLKPKEQSYSVTLRPDFSLFDGINVVGVFDAKFKLDVVDTREEIESFDKIEEAIEKVGDYSTRAKLEDIYKMHTYRDALRVKFAVVVYPGKENMFFGVNYENKNPWTLDDLISKGGAKMEGIGYLRFVPGVKE